MASLRADYGNMRAGYDNFVTNNVNQGISSMENAVGTFVAGLTSIWDGGFVGINTNNVGEIRDAIKNYCNEIEAHIASFNENASLEVAVKGKMNDASQDFIRSVKELLEAYVSTMKASLTDLEVAVQAMETSDSDLSNQISSNAQDIRSAAQAIRID